MRAKTGIYRNCEVCGAKFYVHGFRINDAKRGKYCSTICSYSVRKGIRKSPSTEFKKGQNIGIEHRLWKGNSVGYQALHTWVARRLGKPKECVECGYTSDNGRQFHWANISGEYLRDLSDWKRLCVSCHHKLDFDKPKIPLSRFSYGDLK